MDLRVEKAKVLLRTGATVREAAQELALSEGWFRVLFRDAVGLSPVDFRRQKCPTEPLILVARAAACAHRTRPPSVRRAVSVASRATETSFARADTYALCRAVAVGVSEWPMKRLMAAILVCAVAPLVQACQRDTSSAAGAPATPAGAPREPSCCALLEGSWKVDHYDPVAVRDMGGVIGNQSISSSQARIQGSTFRLHTMAGNEDPLPCKRRDSGPQTCELDFGNWRKSAVCEGPDRFSMQGLELWGYGGGDGEPHMTAKNHVTWVRLDWTGKYSFSESAPALNGVTSVMWAYGVDVAADGAVKVSVDGTQTMGRFIGRSKDQGDRLVVQFVAYDRDNTLADPALKKDDVLFTLVRSGADVVLEPAELKSQLGNKTIARDPAPSGAKR